MGGTFEYELAYFETIYEFIVVGTCANCVEWGWINMLDNRLLLYVKTFRLGLLDGLVSSGIDFVREFRSPRHSNFATGIDPLKEGLNS